jgi:hypothetical protein
VEKIQNYGFVLYKFTFVLCIICQVGLD